MRVFEVKQALTELKEYAGISKADDKLSKRLAECTQLLNKIKSDWFVPNSLQKQLQSKVQALSYRFEKNKENTPSSAVLKEITKKAIEWKKSQIIYGDLSQIPDDKILTEADIAQLKSIACYPDFYPHLNKIAFFKWALLNKMSVDIFVQYPEIVKRINKSLLAMRIGTWGGLKINPDTKDITLCMEGKAESILDKSRQITFKSGFTQTVQEIFKSFSLKNTKEGIFTYFKDQGVVPWDPHAMGMINSDGKAIPIDLSNADWYKNLQMRDYFTAEEATARFGLPCDGTNYILSVVCKRARKNMDTFGSHSFLRILIPLGNNTYAYTYGFGKFLKEYAQNGCEEIGCLFTPGEGTMEYPDNNETYTNRETKEFHYSLDPEKGAACLDSFRLDCLDSQEHRLIFQILTNNCTDWGMKKIKKFVDSNAGDITNISYLDLQPSGVLGTLLKVLRKAPDWIRRATLSTIAFFLGGWREITIVHRNGKEKTVCVLNTPPWDINRPFHHPGKVFIR